MQAPPKVRQAVARHPYTAGWVGFWTLTAAVAAIVKEVL